jgi:hypothetical protein
MLSEQGISPPGERVWPDYEIDPHGCQSVNGAQAVSVLPSPRCDRVAPTLTTRLGVRLRPQSMSEYCIDRSTMAGFHPPFGLTLKIGACSPCWR